MALEVLTGSRPFDGRDENTLREQHLHVAPAPPEGLPAGLSRLLLRLLAKNPADRPQDARGVVEALDRLSARMGTDQEELQRTALEAQRRRAAAEAAHAQGVTAAEVEADHALQALSDLATILQEGSDLAREALPDVEFRGDGAQWHLIWNDTRVTVVPWPRRPTNPAIDDDPLVAAGAVYMGRGLVRPAGNVVCELQGSRMTWWLVRFVSSAFVGGNYQYGPVGIPHGFEEVLFADQRPYMVRSGRHVWQMSKEPLTPEQVVRLLNESIAAS
jgi:hypothetical protein